MARRRLDQHHIRVLNKLGGAGSVGITLPIEVLRALKWRRRQKLSVVRSGRQLILRSWKPKRAKRLRRR